MYRVHLQHFEGPLDLLLFFIRRDELDVYDIPIARIADEFLDYVRVLEEIDLDGVGDFLYMAAQLIHIKTRMLLPGPEVDEEGEPIDPRQELVERLLAYMQFKEAAEALSVSHEDRARQFVRGRAAAPDFEPAAPSLDDAIDVSLFDLVSALRRVLTQAPAEAVHAIEPEAYSVEAQQDFVRHRLEPGQALAFTALVADRSKPFIIATFLAILELARLGEVAIIMRGGVEDFALEPLAPAAPANGLPANGNHPLDA